MMDSLAETMISASKMTKGQLFVETFENDKCEHYEIHKVLSLPF